MLLVLKDQSESAGRDLLLMFKYLYAIICLLFEDLYQLI